jgi:hypothetical protein
MSYGGRYSAPDAPVYRGVVIYEYRDHDGNLKVSTYCRGPYEKPAPAKAMLNRWHKDNNERRVYVSYEERYKMTAEEREAIPFDPWKVIDSYVEVATAWERYEPAK